MDSANHSMKFNIYKSVNWIGLVEMYINYTTTKNSRRCHRKASVSQQNYNEIVKIMFEINNKKNALNLDSQLNFKYIKTFLRFENLNSFICNYRLVNLIKNYSSLDMLSNLKEA